MLNCLKFGVILIQPSEILGRFHVAEYYKGRNVYIHGTAIVIINELTGMGDDLKLYTLLPFSFCAPSFIMLVFICNL